MSEPHRLRQLQELADSVRSGSMSRPDFAEAVADLAREMALHEQRLREVEVPEETVDSLQAELSAAFTGLSLLRQGVERMRRYAEEPLETHLAEGLESVRQGEAELVRAVKMNRRTREDLERRFRGGEPS